MASFKKSEFVVLPTLKVCAQCILVDGCVARKMEEFQKQHVEYEDVSKK